MKKVAFAIVGLACLSAPAFAQDINVRIGDRPREGVVVREHDRMMDRGCRTIITRERHGGTVVVRKVRRCG